MFDEPNTYSRDETPRADRNGLNCAFFPRPPPPPNCVTEGVTWHDNNSVN